MQNSITASFQSRSEAEIAAQQLMARGVPETSIKLEDTTSGEDPTATNVSVGGGVPADVAAALVEAHEGESGAVVLTVHTMGDPNREAASREVLGQIR